MKWQRSVAARFGIAIAATLIALGLTLLLDPYLGRTLGVWFMAAVTVSAWIGGFGPGILSSVLAVLLLHYFFVSPLHSFALDSVSELFSLGVFGLIATLISVGNARLASSRRNADDERQSTERYADRLNRLQVITAALADPLHPRQVGRVIAEQGMAVLGAQSAMVVQLDSAAQMLEVIGESGYAEGALDAWRRFPLSTDVPLAEAVRTGEALWPESRDERTRRYPHLAAAYAKEAGAWLSVPFEAQGRTIGGLSLGLLDDPNVDLLDREFILALARQCAQALDRARVYEAESRARDRAEQAQRRLTFLAEASEVLASSLDYATTLTHVAELAVPSIADWCAIDMVRDGARPERLAVVHSDPAKIAFARELSERYPPDFNAPSGLPAVLRTGESSLFPDITDEMLAETASDPEELRLALELGLRSAMIVAIRVQERVVGAVSLVSAESGRRYGPDDLVLAEELAHRAALAIHNAELYRDSQAAIRSRDEFLSIAAHELKTPLTSLKGFAQLFRRGSSNPSRVAEQVIYQANRLDRLIGELLDVARLETGSLELQLSQVDLVALMSELLQGLSAASPHHRITLGQAPSSVIGRWDRERLCQALENLLNNAVKYSPDGGDITVAIHDGGDHVRVTIQDTGLGIPMERLPHIFDRFYRAPEAAAQVSGFGIGLHIARAAIEAHGGTITAESDGEGRGSRFTVTLPRDSAESINREAPTLDTSFDTD